MDLRLSDFDFELPEELIAQRPSEKRDGSRLLVVPADGDLAHRQFTDLPALLPEGALLIVNDARVIPARVRARKPTGGEVELLFLEPIAGDKWRALLRNAKGLKPGAVLQFLRPVEPEPEPEPGPAPRVIFHGREPDGTAIVSDPRGSAAILASLDAWGELPLPPYIAREHGVTAVDQERYQTVYATTPGAVAAPTAGLHFTPATLAALAARGIERQSITLHVGLGTFAPVRDDDLSKHVMHEERFDIPAATAAAHAAARAAGRPIVAVGTTVVRALEAAAATNNELPAGPGATRLFCTPGYRFRAVDHLITNFHLPRSTLLMLVSAFAGKERILAAYREAVARRYRFFSYGDAMLLSNARAAA